jgi:hypothetical protein
MKELLAAGCTAVALLLTSCATVQKDGGKPVDFTEAHHYFVRNDAPIPSNPITTTQEEFDKLYGCAAVMGNDGLPTPIDFSKQFTIGVILPITNDNTEIIPRKLQTTGDTLTLHYSTKITERNMSWKMQPMSLIIVDKKHLKMHCRLQQVK